MHIYGVVDPTVGSCCGELVVTTKVVTWESSWWFFTPDKMAEKRRCSIGKNPPFVKGNMLGFQECIVDRLAMITFLRKYQHMQIKHCVCTSLYNYILESDKRQLHFGVWHGYVPAQWSINTPMIIVMLCIANTQTIRTHTQKQTIGIYVPTGVATKSRKIQKMNHHTHKWGNHEHVSEWIYLIKHGFYAISTTIHAKCMSHEINWNYIFHCQIKTTSIY